MNKKAICIIAVLLLILTACAVQAASTKPSASKNSVDLFTNVTSLGGQKYQFDFTFENLGKANDAIFKFAIDGLPSSWKNLEMSPVTGWKDKSHGNHLGAQVVGRNKGGYRIFGNSGGPTPGLTSQTFSWTFTTSGIAPTADFFQSEDVTVHIQPINSSWKNDGQSYTVHPEIHPHINNVVPEPSSLLTLGLLAPAAGLFIRRRR